MDPRSERERVESNRTGGERTLDRHTTLPIDGADTANTVQRNQTSIPDGTH